MPRVLVIGATGYLGQAVTQALLRSGQHSVYGLCRSSRKAPALAAIEVIPVVCEDPVNSPGPYLNSIKHHRIDVVIDCTAAYGDSAKFLADVKALGRERLDMFKADGIDNGPKIGYIYTSGAWVHGDSPGHVTDLDPVGTASAPTKSLDLVGWRPQLERQVLAARDVLDVMVFRPAQLYGRGSTAWTPIFGPIAQAVAEGQPKFQVPIAPTSESPIIHVDDVAEGICLGASKISLFGGTSVYPVFDLVSSTENIRDIVNAFASALSVTSSKQGRTQLELVGPGDNPYLQALGSTVRYNSARAQQLLGWTPKRRGLVANMEVYAHAFRASQQS